MNQYVKTYLKITPQKFLSLSKKEKDNIAQIDIIPPKLGSKYFGGFLLKLKNPIPNIFPFGNKSL